MSKLFRKISLKEEGEIPLYLVKQKILESFWKIRMKVLDNTIYIYKT